MNDWLNRSDAKQKRQADRQTLESIDEIVNKWQKAEDKKEWGEKLEVILTIMARNVIEFAKPDLLLEEKIANHREMMRRAAGSLPCIDTTKHRAFTYLMTKMLCVLRRNTMTKEELLEAHKEYREYLASKHPRA